MQVVILMFTLPSSLDYASVALSNGGYRLVSPLSSMNMVGDNPVEFITQVRIYGVCFRAPTTMLHILDEWTSCRAAVLLNCRIVV